MSSDTAWSFSMASAFDDNDSTEEESPEKSPAELQEQQIKDLDISSREDTVDYQPNPFSIAKINAASRSKNSISLVRNAAGQSGNDSSTSMLSQKPLETRRQADIRTAFRKQAQKSCHVAGTRSSQAATFASDISLNSVSAADATSDLGVTTDSDLIGDYAERVIPFKGTPFAEQRSPVTEPRAMVSSIPHILDPAKPDQYHAGEITQMGVSTPNYYGVGTPAIFHQPRSPPFHGSPKRLSLKPSFMAQRTENHGRRHCSSPPVSGRFTGSTPLKSLVPGSQHVGLSPHSRTNRGLFAGLHDTAFPATHNLSRNSFSAPCGVKPASPPAPASDEYDFASDDTLVASPIRSALHLYGATETMAMPSARRTVNQALHDPDEEWSTLPQRKKPKTSAPGMKRDRRTGYFSVNPGLIHGAKKVGVSANSSQRMIKFLPPPLRSVPEYTCNRVNDDRSDHAKTTFIQGMNVST